MPYAEFKRERLNIRPLRERHNKVLIEQGYVSPGDSPRELCAEVAETISFTASRIVRARERGKSVILAFGAHSIKNGLGPVLAGMIEEGWVTHLATNGAGIIHDWEIAYQGATSEDVRVNVDRGQFGMWRETGSYINLAIAIGAYAGLGYGESVGAMIENDSLTVPSWEELDRTARESLAESPGRSAAAADLLDLTARFPIPPGRMEIMHPYKKYSVQAAAYRLRVPFTGHPMFGHDIIYCHPANHGAAIGRTAERDFLSFVESVSGIGGGVYLSVGSAVMSPMIFEKALSMCQNVSIQGGGHIDSHTIVVVDIAPAGETWLAGAEPPVSDEAYYLRYLKTFSRMGGEMKYARVDNRDFLLSLHHELRRKT